MTAILIVPGLGGSDEHHWQTHLERSLPNTRRVHQDDWDRPTRAGWIARLADAVAAAPGAVLVAHSLGCALVAHLALDRPDLRVGAALLVAPADVDDGAGSGRLAAFAPMPRRRLAFPSVVIASRNDPFMRFDRARGLARNWGADFRDAGASGHINVAAGYGRWPAAESLVLALSGSVSTAAPGNQRSATLRSPIRYGT